jgi:heme-degrading monooxygenase HmoA
MLKRVALFPPQERVAEVPADVVREDLLGTLKSIPGFAEAYFSLDRASGRGLSVTLWETEEALRASESAIGNLARAAPGVKIPNPTSVETFEVVYTA